MEESSKKTINPKSVRELNICGGAEQIRTDHRLKGYPGQMMDFLSPSDGKYVK